MNLKEREMAKNKLGELINWIEFNQKFPKKENVGIIERKMYARMINCLQDSELTNILLEILK